MNELQCPWCGTPIKDTDERFTHPITFVLMHKNCGDALLVRRSKEGKS